MRRLRSGAMLLSALGGDCLGVTGPLTSTSPSIHSPDIVTGRRIPVTGFEGEKDSMAERVVIAGYYGFGNIGDEAVLTAMLHDLRQLCPEVEFIVLSENPAQTSSSHKVYSVSWRDLHKVISAIEDSDALIVGGGGLYNSYLEYLPDQLLTPGSSLLSTFIFGLPFLATLLGKPCIIYGVGAGYINSDSAKQHVRLSFELATLATVRDDGSKRILESLGCPTEQVRVTADPAFRLINASPARTRQILEAERLLPARPVMGVVLRSWVFSTDSEQWEYEVATALREFVVEYNVSLLFVPFQKGLDTPNGLSNDVLIIDRITRQVSQVADTYVLRGDYSPAEISGVLASCDLILAMRLHSAILAVKNAVPFVALSYEPKVSSVLRMAGLEEYALELSSLGGGRLLDALRAVYNDRKNVRARLQLIATEMQERALENARLAVELLERREPSIPPPLDSEFGAFLRQFALKQTKLLIREKDRTTALEAEVSAYQGALRRLVENHQFDAALSVFEHLLSERPHQPEWNYLAGLSAHMARRDLERALNHYDLALEQGFDEFWARYNRGALLAELGDLERALADLERAAELNPDHDGAKASYEDVVKRTTGARQAKWKG